MAQKGDKPPFSFWSGQQGRSQAARGMDSPGSSPHTRYASGMFRAWRPGRAWPVLTGSKGHKGNR